jgi:hypothetical protein
MRGRTARVSLADSIDRVHDVDVFPELVLGFELRPMARKGRYAAGLVTRVDASFSLALDGADPEGSSVDTNAFRLSLAAGYLVPVGDWLEVGASAGFGYDAFVLGDNTVLPSSQYLYARIAGMARASLVGSLLRAEAELGGRFSPSTGDLGAAFSESDGARGFDLGLGVGGELDVGFAYAARFGFTRYELDFKGAGSAATGNGGSDRGWSVSLQLGYGLH